MSTTEPRDTARWRTHNHLMTVAQILDGDGVLVRRPVTWGSGTVADVSPLPAIRAAVFLSGVAQERMRHYAQDARGEGRTWKEIGQALGLAEAAGEQGQSLAAAAWYLVLEGIRPGWSAPHRQTWATIVSWRCSGCERQIRDHGPFGEPDEGHASFCARQVDEDQGVEW